MKVLIAAACICVIGLTAYFAMAEYASYKRGTAIAFQMKCDDAIAESKDTSAMADYEKRILLRTLNECMDRVRGK